MTKPRRALISEWFDAGVDGGFDFMLIGIDTFDDDPFPIYSPASELQNKLLIYDDGHAAKIKEVYSLQSDREAQLNEEKAWHLEPFALKFREGDQPLPIHNDHPDIQSRVIADIEERRQLGIQRYGQALQPENGRDMLWDAYEEALDLAIYLRGEIENRRLAAARDAAMATSPN